MHVHVSYSHSQALAQLPIAQLPIAQLPVACNTDPRPASHHLQYRPSPSFPSFAVQTLAQLPIACSTDTRPASHRLQYWPSPSFLSLAVLALTQLPVACSKLSGGLGARLYIVSSVAPVPTLPRLLVGPLRAWVRGYLHQAFCHLQQQSFSKMVYQFIF